MIDFGCIDAIVTDIEGTTTPISFVRDVLFPYAQVHLAEFLADHGEDDAVQAILREVKQLEPDQSPLATLLGWMSQDAKVTPLKTLQGLIWEHGYHSGVIEGPIYPDVPRALRHWKEAGKKLFVYSSGSVAAQKLIFGFSDAGDLCPLFDGYFDTQIGAKREAESYRAIAATVGMSPERLLFLSDIGAELDAARDAGWRTTQLVRAEDNTIPSDNHPNVAQFAAVFGDA